MNILKILKIYLIFILTITGLSVLGYNPTVKHYFAGYFASVTHSDAEYKNFTKVPTVEAVGGVVGANYLSDKLRKNREFVDNAISLTVSNDPDKSFARPGAKDVEVMQLKFNGGDRAATIKSLTLKLEGVSSEKITKIYLTDESGNLAVGSRDGDYFKFNLNYELDKNSQQTITIKADLSEDIQTHERFRINIENMEGIELTEAYPILGPYLTIARPRPWSKNWNQAWVNDDVNSNQ